MGDSCLGNVALQLLKNTSSLYEVTFPRTCQQLLFITLFSFPRTQTTSSSQPLLASDSPCLTSKPLLDPKNLDPSFHSPPLPLSPTPWQNHGYSRRHPRLQRHHPHRSAGRPGRRLRRRDKRHRRGLAQSLCEERAQAPRLLRRAVGGRRQAGQGGMRGAEPGGHVRLRPGGRHPDQERGRGVSGDQGERDGGQSTVSKPGELGLPDWYGTPPPRPPLPLGLSLSLFR